MATALAFEIAILGPIQVHYPDVTLARRQHRLLLGILALEANRKVSSDRLADLLWDESAPKRPRAVIHSRMSELRSALAGAGPEPGIRLLTDGNGYLLQIDPGRVDSHRFLELVRRAPAEEHPERARLLLRRALSLWRGPMLGGWLPENSHTRLCHTVESARLSATEDLCEVELRLGAHREVVDELVDLSLAHPGRERLTAAAMIALRRAGRAAEAVLVYDRCRRWHADNLGIDPGPELQRLNIALLRGDGDALDLPAVTPPPRTAPVPSTVPATMAQLPAGVSGFVGRAAHIRRVQALLTEPADSIGTAVVTLAGPPGVGKTALAVHLGHLLRPAFPDGQLFVDLRGYSAERPLAADEVLYRFLRALGLPPDRIPRDQTEKSVLFRSTLAGRRVLLVLDNAGHPGQIRPVLPAGGGCALIVTSRDQLHGLTAVDGARLVPVGTLPDDEAQHLLASVLGRERTDAEPEAAVELARMCGRLPLALRIAAAYLTARPEQTIASYTDRVRSGGPLAALKVQGDESAAVERAIELSYRKLEPSQARLFRLLCLVPGPDLDPYTVANLAGAPREMVQEMLDRLVTLSLIEADGPDRYRLHDLIRDFGRKEAVDPEGGTVGAEAVRRLFDYYLAAADTAGTLLYRDTPRYSRPEPATRPALPDLSTPAAATEWLDTQVVNVVSAIVEWSERPDGLPVWLVADAFYGYFLRRRRNAFWLRAYTASLAAAVEARDPAAEAWTRCGLANYYFQQLRNRDASTHFGRAVETFSRLGDTRGQARARNGLGMVGASWGDYDQAIKQYRHALRLLRAAPADQFAVTVACNLGNTLVMVGQLGPGLAELTTAGAAAEKLSLPHAAGRARTGTALVRYLRGELTRSEQDFGHALDLWTELGVETGQSEALRYLAAIQLDLGRPREAIRLAQQALALGERAEDRWMVDGARLVVGDTLLELGRIKDATAQFEKVRVEDRGRRRHYYAWATVGLATCRRRSGDLAAARALATDATTDVRPYVACLATLELARVQAAAHLRQEAVEHTLRVLAHCWTYDFRLVGARAAQLLVETLSEAVAS